MNRVVTPNLASITASTNFIRTVSAEMEKQKISKARLARIAQVERKTVYSWLDGRSSPKLDSVAQIYRALGFEEVRISLTEVQDETED